MKDVAIRIEGMYCDQCRRVVRRALAQVNGVVSAQVTGDVAHLHCNEEIDPKVFSQAVAAAGYFTSGKPVSANAVTSAFAAVHPRLAAFGIFVVLVAVIVGAAAALNAAVGFNVFNAIPVVDRSIPLGMLFVTGLFTGLHCISMCGALNLASATATATPNLRAPLAYNVGRLISYSALGALAGALGGVVSLNRTVQVVLLCAAAALMVALALRMAGVVVFEVPRIGRISPLVDKVKDAGPFAIGLANGLMPCGPLQAMQIYALTTGSAPTGALAMLLFGLGTAPAMLGVGYAANALRGRARVMVGRVAAAFMFVLAVSMLARGLAAGGVTVTAPAPTHEGYLSAVVEDNVQVVQFSLEYDSYADFTVRAGMPVRVIISVDETKLTGCNNEVLMEPWGIDQHLEPGENVIEFTPTQAGTYTYSCWMHMITNTIEVVE